MMEEYTYIWSACGWLGSPPSAFLWDWGDEALLV